METEIEKINNKKISEEIDELLFFEKLVVFFNDRPLIHYEDVIEIRDYYRNQVRQII